MIRHFRSFAFLVAVLGLAAVAFTAQSAPLDQAKYQEALGRVPGYIDLVMKEPDYADAMKRLDAVVSRYTQRETPMDSEAGRAYIASKLATGTTQIVLPTSPEPVLSSGDESTDGADSMLTGLNETGQPVTDRTVTSPAGTSPEQFRDSVKSFDDVRAYVIRDLYAEAEKLKVALPAGTLRGLHPTFFYICYLSKQNRIKSDVIPKLSSFFGTAAVKDQFTGVIAAYKAKGDEPARALGLLDAYLEFRKQGAKADKRQAVSEAALQYSEQLAKTYYAASLGTAPGTTSSTLSRFALWANQHQVLSDLSQKGSGQPAASNAYAWFADALLLIDATKSASSQDDSGRTSSGVSLEDYQARLANLDKYMSDLRSRQRKLAELLRTYQESDDDAEREQMRKQILDLYCGDRSGNAPLPVLLAKLQGSDQVAMLARELPEGADPGTKARRDRLFNRQVGTIPVAFQTQDSLDQAMIANGFGDAVDEARLQAQREREQAATRRRKPGEQDSGGNNSGGFWQGANNVMAPLSQAAGPIANSIFQADQQRRQAELEERYRQGQIDAATYERERAEMLRQSQQNVSEQQAGLQDRDNTMMDSAQRTLAEQAERERLEQEAYNERQRQLAAERQKEEQARQAALAAQNTSNQPAAPTGTNTANPNGTNTGTTGGNNTGTTGTTGSTGQNPAAPGTTPQNGATGTTQGGTQQGPALLTDAQILEVAKTKITLVANQWGVDPAVLSDAEIKAVVDPLISERVAKYNQELSSKHITVNADLQYSGPGITSTGLPPGHDRYAMWMTRFPEMKGAANQVAQKRYNELLQQQVNILVAARAQQQAATRPAGTPPPTPSPIAVAQTPTNQPAAPQSTTPTNFQNLSTNTPGPAATQRESTEVISARKVIAEYDEKAEGSSEITPHSFLNGLSVYNSTTPQKLGINLTGLVKLVKLGYVKSKIPPPVIDAELGPNGREAQRVIDEYDRRAGGKSGITPQEFLDARDRLNATNPYKVEINLPGLIRLVNIGMLKSKVPPPRADSTTQPAAPTNTGMSLDDPTSNLTEPGRDPSATNDYLPEQNYGSGQ